MKEYKNGICREIEQEELPIEETLPTDAERIEALEMAMLELAEVLANG